MKMYVLIYFLFILNKYFVSSGDSISNESKYVDLLPEEEKEEFLRSIARRIFEETQAKDDHHKASGEISDDQLNEHAQFVEKILQEETDNLRRDRGEDNKKDLIKSHDSEEKLRVKSLVKDEMSIEHEISGDRKNIDLTLRQDIKRKKRDRIGGVNEEKEKNLIKVESQYYENHSDANENSTTFEDNSKTMMKENKNNDNKTVELNENTEQSDIEDIQVKYMRSNASANNGNSGEYDAITVSDISQMTNFDIQTTENNSEKNNFTFNPSKELTDPTDPSEIIPEETDAVSTQSKEEVNLGITQKIFESLLVQDDSKMESLGNETTADYLTSVTTANVTSISTTAQNATKQNAKNEVNESKRAVRSYTEIETENYDIVTDKISKMEITQHKIDVIIKNIEGNKGFTVDMPPTIINTESTIVETIPPLTIAINDYTNVDMTVAKNKDNSTSVPKHHVKYNLSVPNKFKIVEKNEVKHVKNHSILSKNDSNTNQNIEYDNKVIKVLRQGILKENQNEFDEKKSYDDAIHSKYATNKMKEYSVYEILPYQLPFVLNQKNKKVQEKKKNKEQPYYVPIYNYSPNKAYFNAHNRFGPNVDDPSSEIEGRSDIDNVSEVIDTTADDEHEDELKTDLNDELNYQSNQKKFSFGKKREYPESKISIKPNYKAKSSILMRTPILYGNLHYKPNVHLGMDYYFGGKNIDTPYVRTIKSSINNYSNIFPASDEEYHPFSNKIKDHIRAVRQILYKKPHFGFIPPVSTSQSESKEGAKKSQSVEATTEYRYNRHMRARKQDIDEISNKRTNSNYYFDLTKINISENDHLNDNKDIYLSMKDFPDIKKIQLQYPFNNDYGIVNTNTVTEQSENSDQYIRKSDINNFLKKIGYVKHFNNIKDLYLSTNAFPGSLNGDDVTIIKLQHPFRDNGGKLVATSFEKEFKNIDNNVQKSLQIRSKVYSKDNSTYDNFDTIKKILSITDEKDLFMKLDKLLTMNLSIARSNAISNDIKVYVDVLKDMIVGNSKALKQYDWLLTTVEIQGALKKLFELTESLQNGEKMHPSDFQLGKYVIYLLKISEQSMNDEVIDIMGRGKYLLTVKKKRKKIIKQFRPVLRKDITSEDVDIDNFIDFLNDLQEALYDLHDSIKHVAMVMKYKKQNWFENLKQVYLKFDTKQLIDVILHLSTTRLFGLIEESAKNGLEDDFERYVMTNGKDVRRTIDEFTFVLRLLNEIKRLDG